MAVADLVKTTLGPKGMVREKREREKSAPRSAPRSFSHPPPSRFSTFSLHRSPPPSLHRPAPPFPCQDKILQSVSRGRGVTVTNDGATILRSLHVDNPAAKVLVDLSRVQDEAAGDGTTSVVVLAGELLRGAEALVNARVHPMTVVAGYRAAAGVAAAALEGGSVDRSGDPAALKADLIRIARTTLSSKILSGDRDKFAALAVDAVLRLKGSTDLSAVHILKKAGGTLAESWLDEGFILAKPVGVGQPARVENARILVANTAMDTDKIKIYGRRGGERERGRERQRERERERERAEKREGNGEEVERAAAVARARTFSTSSSVVRSLSILTPFLSIISLPLFFTHSGARVRVDSMAKVAELEAAERSKMADKVKAICDTGATVFVNRQLIYNYPESLFADAGVMAVEHADFEGVERLALVTGAAVASSFGGGSGEGAGPPPTLGKAALVHEIMIGEDAALHFSGVARGDACTIVLRGASSHVLDEAERSLHDALCVLSQTVADARVVWGGGWPEVRMAHAVSVAAAKTPGKAALAMEAYAAALRAIPATICENAGLDAADTVARLRAAHAAAAEGVTSADGGVGPRDACRAGVDVIAGGMGDMEELGVFESYKVRAEERDGRGAGRKEMMRDWTGGRERERERERGFGRGYAFSLTNTLSRIISAFRSSARFSCPRRRRRR